MKWLACFVFAFAGSGVAFAQTVTLGIDSRGEVYAGMPFVLSVSAQGFEETPEPTVSDFTMDGATVTFLGMSPNVASSVTIINGRRSATRQVTFVYRYRVSVDTPGTYEVPAITVTQGKKSASSRPGRFSAKDIAKSRDMKIRVKLPARPVWVGETIPLAIELFLAKDPQGNPTFSVPLFEAEDWLIVRAQEPNGRRALPFTVGARDLELPYDRDTTSLDGKQYTRFTFHATLTPKKAGILDVAPARVVAALAAGRGRDAFGFPTMRTRLFKAEDQKRKLEMRALPLSGRPRTFSGAVGSAFSMSVRASRTVVAVGDPIELEVTIRGNTDLTVLGLPNLSGEGGLPADGFDVPQEFSPGTVAEDGSQKVFRVTVRLKSTAVTEIPALVFSITTRMRQRIGRCPVSPSRCR